MSSLMESMRKNSLYIKGSNLLMKSLSKVSPKTASKKQYRGNFGRPLDLSNPDTLNAKLMYLKLCKYWNNPKVSMCADKYKVREYIENHGCPEILNTLYGVWDNPNDIDWDKLPNKFVIKCNHGSGYNILCTDKSKFDTVDAVKNLDRWMHERYGVSTMEQGIYNLIDRKIIAEAYIETEDGFPPKDIKFFCSFGKVLFLFVATDRHDELTKFDYYWPDWTYIPVRNHFPNRGPIDKPKNLEEMEHYAEKLSTDFPLVRVDFYTEQNKIYFGELTFTHFGCLCPFEPDEYDYKFGECVPNIDVLSRWE